MQYINREQEKHLFALCEYVVTLPETGQQWPILAKSAAQAKRKVMGQKLRDSQGVRVSMLRARQL